MLLNNLRKLSRRYYSTVDGIVVSRRNDKAILQFDRPAKRNAMSIEMQVNFGMQLRDFESDPSVSAVIIKGNEVGFSAGGDVVQFAKLLETSDETMKYFFDTCTLFYRGLLRLSEFKKPVISLADKVCMGGGAAVAFLSSHPVVTERTVFSMPEVFIGLFPNVAANYFLVQLPHNFDMWLGLTGRRFIGPDIINLGLSKNYIKSDDMDRLEDALINLKITDTESVNNTIAQFKQNSDVSNCDINPSKVEQLFSGNSLEEIIENLKNDNSEFSNNILQLFSTVSPTSLKMTFNIFRESKRNKYSCNDALSADFSLFKNFYGVPGDNINDFREGIRSMLINKNHKPNWMPKTLKEVDDKKLISCFTNNVVDIRSSSQ